ncbi:hypothetical protein ACWEQJ_11965 [Streptomyces cyaneofuscatus]
MASSRMPVHAMATPRAPVARMVLSRSTLALSGAELDERWASMVEEDGFIEVREARVVLGLPVEDRKEHEGVAEGHA